jgi:hypothetical protein
MDGIGYQYEVDEYNINYEALQFNEPRMITIK